MVTEIKSRLEELLDFALIMEGASMGNIQMYRKETKDLVIVAHKGFNEGFLEYFKVVKPFDSSSCGRALGIGAPVMISDVEQDISFRPHIEIARESGFRAVKSVPILNYHNEYVGVISTHFSQPKSTWETERLNEVLSEISFLL